MNPRPAVLIAALVFLGVILKPTLPRPFRAPSASSAAAPSTAHAAPAPLQGAGLRALAPSKRASYPHLRLTYFEMPARGDLIRLALRMGHVPFEDVRVPMSEWPALKPHVYLGQLPVFEVDGVALSQSLAILRYVGRLTGLYPVDDAWRAALVDEVLDTTSDIMYAVHQYVGPDPSQKEVSRQWFSDNAVPRFWGGLDARVRTFSQTGPFIFGDKPNVADLGVAMIYNLFAVNQFFKTDPAPFMRYERLKQVRDAVMEIPEVKEYYRQYPLV